MTEGLMRRSEKCNAYLSHQKMIELGKWMEDTSTTPPAPVDEGNLLP
jgi:hypothetical protein